MIQTSVKVTGLRELGKAFKQIDDDLPKELKGEFLGIARRVANVVVQRMPFRDGQAAASVGARATVRGASIVAGGAPYYQWLDFGGSVGRGHKAGVAGSGSVKRVFIKGGRYIYPALADERKRTEAAVDAAVTHTALRAGFEVKGGV